MLVIPGVCLFLFCSVQTWTQIDKCLNLSSDVYLLRLLNYFFISNMGLLPRVECDTICENAIHIVDVQ